jgi:hypothetical protein
MRRRNWFLWFLLAAFLFAVMSGGCGGGGGGEVPDAPGDSGGGDPGVPDDPGGSDPGVPDDPGGGDPGVPDDPGGNGKLTGVWTLIDGGGELTRPGEYFADVYISLDSGTWTVDAEDSASCDFKGEIWWGRGIPNEQLDWTWYAENPYDSQVPAAIYYMASNHKASSIRVRVMTVYNKENELDVRETITMRDGTAGWINYHLRKQN